MKCVIFDCDGVLVDSEIITTTHFLQHMRDFGYSISVEEAIKRFTGKSDQMVYEAITEETGMQFSPEQIDEIQDQIHAHYDWYKQRMSAYKVPIAHNSMELAEVLASI
jgi:beta-phosphoglucomutase-like phosphatase (HAD superfamily)